MWNITDASGAITDWRNYDAFGNFDDGAGMSGVRARFGGTNGYRADDNGLLLLGHRYYDSKYGRFITQDPIGLAGGDLNLYGYCGNNPLTRTDPDGLDWLDDAANFSAGWGDALTLGGTGRVREWIHIGGESVNTVVDENSGCYWGGAIVGTVHGYAMGPGPGSGSKLGRIPKIPKPKIKNPIRIPTGRGKARFLAHHGPHAPHTGHNFPHFQTWKGQKGVKPVAQKRLRTDKGVGKAIKDFGNHLYQAISSWWS